MRSLFAELLLASLLCLTVATPAYPQSEYRDTENGVTLSVPPGWKWIGPDRWGNRESTLTLKEAGNPQELRLYIKLFDTPEKIMPAAKMDKRLLKMAQRKVEQRTREGFQDYHLRDGSCELHPINGRSALSCVADYTDHGRNMVEYLTRVRCENMNALFFARMPAEQLDAFKARVDPIVETLQVP